MMRSLRFALTIVLATPACAGPQTPAASQAERDIPPIQARLVAGPWRLADYRPDVPLEPMLQALLGQQVRTMVVRFDGRTLAAVSPTLQVSRPYTLEHVAGLAFDLVSPDIQGGGQLRSRCEIAYDGRRITFRAQTEPWIGTGVLDREGP
jgi:hypothetical protein